MAARIREYTPAELAGKRTLAEGPDGLLKVATGRYKVWLHGEAVTYQALYQNRWTACNPDGTFL